MAARASEGEDDDGDGLSPDDLDPWRKLARDIAVKKAEEREGLSKQPVTQFRGYQLTRLLITGYAGSGKSRTLRAIARSLRRVLKKRGADAETVRKCCALGAPTACASFHMKYGAATAHQLWGLRACETSFERVEDLACQKYEAEGRADAYV